jgi:hypothetical protein
MGREYAGDVGVANLVRVVVWIATLDGVAVGGGALSRWTCTRCGVAHVTVQVFSRTVRDGDEALETVTPPHFVSELEIITFTGEASGLLVRHIGGLSETDARALLALVVVDGDVIGERITGTGLGTVAVAVGDTIVPGRPGVPAHGFIGTVKG